MNENYRKLLDIIDADSSLRVREGSFSEELADQFNTIQLVFLMLQKGLLKDNSHELKELREENQRLKISCEAQCRQAQVKILVEEYQVPPWLLEGSYAVEVLAQGSLPKVKALLKSRHNLLFGSGPRVVLEDDIEGE